MTILVTGGTGTLGRQLVPRLVDAGRAVRVLSRRGGEARDGIEHVSADLDTGEGVAAALDGVETVVHLAGGAKGDDVKAHNLVTAAAPAGVRHLVYISVVGADGVPMASAIDRMMFGYFESKLAAERVVAGSGIPWTTLRATQFHDLILRTAQAMSKLPVVVMPKGMRFQPIDAGEVAARLVDLARGVPSGRVADVAGPKVYTLTELVGGYMRAIGRRRPIIAIGLPGAAARAVRDGANLAPDNAVGHRTWEDFLARST